MQQEQLPSAVGRQVEQYCPTGGSRVLTTSTDITLDGRCEKQWLVVSEHQVTVTSDGETPISLCSVPTEAVERYRTTSALGCGSLQVRVNGIWIDLLRYSNGLASRFARVAASLEEFRTTGQLISLTDVDEGRRCATCGMVQAIPGDVCPRCIDRGAILGRVWQLIKPYRRQALVMCILIVLGVVAELVPPKLQQYLVDHVLRFEGNNLGGEDLVGLLLILVATLAITRLILAAVNSVKGHLASQVGTALTADLRAQLVQRLQKLPVDYYDRHPVGVLMSRVTHDTEALYGLINQFTSGFLLQVLQLLGVGVMLFLLNPKLALWTMIPTPFVLFGSWFFWRYVYPKYHRYWDAASKQAASLAGMLTGIRVVKAFAQEDHEFARFQRTSGALQVSRTRVEISSATFSALMQLIFSLGGLIVWFVGGREVLHGQMTLGALMAFLAYLAMFYAPLASLAQFTTWLTSFMTASQRVFDLLETPIGILDPDHPEALPRMEGTIRFDKVSFGYDRNNPLLKNFDLEIKAGQFIGVVGRSGSGKTTLVNLICRFYDVDAGSVAIDGCDVRRIDRADLRSQIGVVLQEPFLFRGSVWENLVYGRPEAAVEEALTAAKGANAHEFIMRLPFAYDTPLGERGAGLSGGEKQRLSIARALLYDPRVLILDEATSSVDTESEKAIQEALALLTRGRTTIAVSHRLSTLRNANRILVMDRGQLAEQGSHQDLLALGGLYAKLVSIQSHLHGRELNGFAGENGQAFSSQATNGTKPPGKAAAFYEQWNNGPLTSRWLTPTNSRIELGDHATLRVFYNDEIHGGVFAIAALPATCPGQFVSLRRADIEGQAHEIGIVRTLAEWPHEQRLLLERAIGRQHFVRQITAIESIEGKHGLLTFRVQTDRGPSEFTIRISHSQVQDYGKKSKILIDVEENHFLIADVDALPRADQSLFRRFIYW
jgi:ATP-binding cassette subfamily B protein